MREFKPEVFVNLIGQFERNYAYEQAGRDPEKRSRYVLVHLETLKKEADRFGLAGTADKAQFYIEERIGSPIITPTPLGAMASALRRELMREMTSLCYLEIPQGRRSYWNQQFFFGLPVYDHFPDARRDIEEAANCYALAQWTASAFHSLRSQEHGINALCQAVGAALPKENERSWGKVLTKIDNSLNYREKSTDPDWQIWAPQMRTAYAFLSNAKSLWRDDTMHVGHAKDEKEALRIIESTRILMEHLAGWINQEGIFHGKT
jgi:hypothetical protein